MNHNQKKIIKGVAIAVAIGVLIFGLIKLLESEFMSRLFAKKRGFKASDEFTTDFGSCNPLTDLDYSKQIGRYSSDVNSCEVGYLQMLLNKHTGSNVEVNGMAQDLDTYDLINSLLPEGKDSLSLEEWVAQLAK